MRALLAASLLAALLVTTARAASARAGDLPIQVPSFQLRVGDDPAWVRSEADDAAWSRVRWFEVDPQGRLLWARARVRLADTFDRRSRPLGLHVSAMASYEAYWNGALLGRNGRPGASPADEQPGAMHAVFFIPPDLIRSGDNLLAIRISSHHLSFPVSFPIHMVAVGTYEEPLAGPLRAYLPALLVSGIVAMGAIYFALLFLADRRDRSSLYLSLLSLCVIGQVTAETLRAFVNYPYPWHLARLAAIAGFACAFGLALVLYVGGRFSRSGPARYAAAYAALLPVALLVGAGLDGKAMVALLAASLIALVAAVAGARAGKPGARPAAAALLLFTLLQLLQPLQFLDLTFYLAVASLLAVLFPLQIVALRRERALREGAELRSTRLELDLLKRQIQPHFLMNTLTTLSEWIESDPAMGVQMIDALAEEFRLLSTMGGHKLVTAGQELELCRHHLRVLSLRADRLFTLRAESIDPDGRVPPTVFHTLLENAFTHNAFPDGAEFLLEESRTADQVSYRLTCPPPLRRRNIGDSAGTGLTYVKARLTEAFGDAWTLRSAPSDDGGWVTHIALPAG